MKEQTVKPSSRYSLEEGCCEDSSKKSDSKKAGKFLSACVVTGLQANGFITVFTEDRYLPLL
jgi:hypothetical protein